PGGLRRSGRGPGPPVTRAGSTPRRAGPGARASRRGVPVRAAGSHGAGAGGLAAAAVLPGRLAVAGLEDLAEVRRVLEAPAARDGLDPALAERRVFQVAPAVLQAPLAHPAGHRGALVVEELVQVADRDVVRRRDGDRVEFRV